MTGPKKTVPVFWGWRGSATRGGPHHYIPFLYGGSFPAVREAQ